MKTAIITTGIASLMFGVIVEIIGVFYGSDALQHNAYGWAGGILIVLGACNSEKDQEIVIQEQCFIG